jgi:hypothetical protein
MPSDPGHVQTKISYIFDHGLLVLLFSQYTNIEISLKTINGYVQSDRWTNVLEIF